jgi:hypothetical protein
VKTVQRLSKENSLSKYDLPSYTSIALSSIDAAAAWTMSNGTFVYTGDDFYVGSHYVISASPDSSSPIELSLDVNDIFEVDDVGQLFVFSCVVFCAQKSVTVNIKLFDENGAEVDFNSKTIQAGTWTAVRSNVLEIEASDFESTSYKVLITVEGHEKFTIKVSTPNLVNDSTWALNPVIQSIRPYIPGFYESYDRRETNPQYPFFRFIDVLTDSIADTMFLYSEWFQLDSREIIPGFSKTDLNTRSRLTNYKAVYDENLEWLSQFSGNKLKKQIYIGSTPLVTDTDGFKEAQLYPAIYGRGAGTQGALKEAIGFALTGTKTVIIGQKAGGNPWAIRAITLASETPNLDVRTNVRAATTVNINISTDLEAGDTIDDVVLVAGDRVLVKNQNTASQNGVYIVSSSGAASRATDFDSASPSEVATGAIFIVKEGSANEKNAYELTTQQR